MSTYIFGKIWVFLLGPNISSREIAVCLIPTLVATIIIPFYFYWEAQDCTWYQLVLTAFLSFDLVGGAIVNVCESTKNWHHRHRLVAQGWKHHHFTFVAVHMHPFLVVWAYGGQYFDAIVAFTFLLIATLTILHSSYDVQHPISVTMYLLSLALSCNLFQDINGMSWLLPTYFLKLLLCYLPPPSSQVTRNYNKSD